MRAEDRFIKYMKAWFLENKDYKYKWINTKFGRELKKCLIDSGNWRKKKREGVPLPVEFIQNKIKSKWAPFNPDDEDFE